MEQSNKIQPRLANSSLRLESGIWNLGSRVSKLDFTLADKKVEKVLLKKQERSPTLYAGLTEASANFFELSFNLRDTNNWRVRNSLIIQSFTIDLWI